jgi:MoaA/NifB/PqqE/SkfB family radical SAM enzyme
VALANSYWDLLNYKLRHTGLLNTIRVGCLDLSEYLLYAISRQFPSVSISPRSIQIECTTRCNLKCTFCELSYWTEKAADLQFDSFKKMVDHLPNLKRIDLTGIGEAFMNRDFFRILELLKSRGVYVMLNDNFTLMTEKAARRLVELEVDHIYLSLDGATKQTYEEIRVGANFDKVISNARRLLEIKRATGKKRPEIKINTVVCMTNYQELPAIIELAYDLGIGMVTFVNVITFESTAGLDTLRVQREIQSKFQDALQRARKLGVLVKLELFDKLPVQECDFPWKRNFVTYDGYVHPCCYTTQTGDRKAQNGRSFGNLVEKPFHTLWSSDLYAGFRRKMREGVLPHECEHCPKYTGKRDDAPKQPLHCGRVAHANELRSEGGMGAGTIKCEAL